MTTLGSSGTGGRIIAFEGMDGSGKSTVIKAVAERLRQSGVKVCIPRAGKEHASRPARRIRRLTRDPRNLDLLPRAELSLYCAREAQIMEEFVRPALERGETVLLDRSLLTPVILGAWGRGLPRDECEGAARLASGGIEPDLTLVFDVHPRTSRIRKRVEKIRTHTLGKGGRKGLAGSGLKERVRQGYLEVARERGYPLFHVERITPQQLAERVIPVVENGIEAMPEEDEDDARPVWMVPDDWDLAKVLDELPVEVGLFLSNGLVAARDLRARAMVQEPELVAWSLDPLDPLREKAAEREPDYALRGWARRPLSGSEDLRVRLLGPAPAAAISALKHVDDPEADELRAECADRVPGAVVASLTGREDHVAEELRRRCWSRAEPEEHSASLTLCGGETAWRLREQLMSSQPVLGLESLRGVAGARAQELLEAFADRAPKTVLRALSGRTDARAHVLRERLFETGREVVDSVRGLDDEPSWALRERAVARWPSTVVHSLFGLPEDERVKEMREHCMDLGGIQ
jgi:dTMP kinase